MENDMISVLICCYNDEKFLKKALDSVFSQTLNPTKFEVIFIDDGSTDSSSAIARDVIDNPNFVYFRNHENVGLVASCNRGLKLAKGNWVIRLDADDAFAPEMLERMHKYVNSAEGDLIYTDRIEVYLDKDCKKEYVDLRNFNLFNLIAPGVMMRKNILDNINGYRNLFWEEYDLYIRYLQYGRKHPIHIPGGVYYYSKYKGSMTSDHQRVSEGWRELIKEWGIETLKSYGYQGEMHE